MDDSPLAKFLAAVDTLDHDAVIAQFAPDARLLTADGRHAKGINGVRELMSEFLGELRTTTHRITAQWHQDNVWIAEVDATYELTDWMETGTLPRAFVMRAGSGGQVADLRVYGAHERRLSDHRTGEEGMWVGERWIPPL